MPEHPDPKPRPHPYIAASHREAARAIAQATALMPVALRASTPPILVPDRPPPPPPPPALASDFAELWAFSNYTFLTGASHPDELVTHAKALGYRALALTDRHSLAGIVRAHVAAKEAGLQFIIGAHITMRHALDASSPLNPSSPPGPSFDCLLYPTSRDSYAALCRLLTLGKRRAPKGECYLSIHDVLDTLTTNPGGHELLTILIPPSASGPAALNADFVQFVTDFRNALFRETLFRDSSHSSPSPLAADRLSLAVTLAYDGHDDDRTTQLTNLAHHTGVPLVAAGRILYHQRERAALQDVLTCIRSGCALPQAGTRLEPSAERFLKPLYEINRLFAACPGAVARTAHLARRCAGFSLDQIRYEYPDEVVPPATTPMQHLTELVWRGARERYPTGAPQKVITQILHELRLIDELRYAHYFLTVHDIVLFARSRQILCQGRGAAANSAVCYCLGITAVDPERIDVLFERFISRERNEPPDIDIDFEHERREEVIQYIYAKYGRDRAALTAEVISYRPRSAVRDIGKALGLSLDTVDAIAKNLDWWDKGLAWSAVSSHPSRQSKTLLSERLQELGFDPSAPSIQRLMHLAGQLIGFPRHLSQHVGGFVITKAKLCDLVPIENASMEDRTIIEWDKDDVDAAGLLKVDILGLGMLTCIRRAFDFVNAANAGNSSAPTSTSATSTRSAPPPLALHTIPPEDPAVYDAICNADTIGVFQIESRAQMSMLPRLRPRCFYDLVIEVAIVRPGPIQGNMVHPYLRRRNGEEPATYPDEAVKKVLGKTLGVPLFQEQAMALSIVAAGFSPGEADQLRRAIAAWKTKQKVIYHFGKRLIEGMINRGYPAEFAHNCFEQIKGFSEYGFPESHAASFALLVYASAWLKVHHPAAFAAALMNSQPMGFYAPAQIVQDAQRHHVTVREIDIHRSGWDCRLEYSSSNSSAPPASAPPALRLGLRLAAGLGEDQGRLIEHTIASAGPFKSIQALWRAGDIKVAALRALANADAFRSMNLDRQHALWAIAELKDDDLPLFDSLPPTPAATQPAIIAPATTESTTPLILPRIAPSIQVLHDYASTGLSLKAHPVSFLRQTLEAKGCIAASALATVPLRGIQGRQRSATVAIAGIVLGRQRPSTAKGIMFVTVEDESGPANIIVRPKVYERYRSAARHSTLMLIRGSVERQGQVIHLIARRIEDVSPLLSGLNTSSRDFR